MSKKRPTESSWDSDEELLSDTSGITAFPKTSELDLMGDDGELDEDALLGMDEAGAKAVSVSFANDSMRSMAARQRSKTTIAHQPPVLHDPAADEQAFVFEETDTADLEDELSVSGQEADNSAYHDLYHGGGDASGELVAHDENGSYAAEGMPTGDGGDMVYMEAHSESAGYGNGEEAVYEETTAQVSYAGEEEDDTQVDSSGVELGYEQPEEQDEQVHLEYATGQLDTSEEAHTSQGDSGHYESESDSDDESSRHSRGKFTTERTGVISLAPATARETIPDTLEINEEQAAQIEQFMTDKSRRGKGKAQVSGRLSAHSRLGNRTGTNPPQGLLQGPRMGPGPQGLPGQPPQMGFMFPGGPQIRGPYPGRMMGPRGPFPARFVNQRGPFPVGPASARSPFIRGPRGPFLRGSPRMMLGGPQRGAFPPNQGRFPGPKGLFPGGPPPPGSPRMPQQSLRGPLPGSAQMPPPNQQMKPPGQFQQRGPPSAQLGQRPQQMGQVGVPGSMAGPRFRGPTPLMGRGGPGARMHGPMHITRPPATSQQGHPIPSLVKPVAALSQAPAGSALHRLGPQNSLRQPEPRRISPHQRLGPMQGPNRPQGHPNMPMRAPISGGPQMGPAVSQPLFSGQGGAQLVRKHKIYINPRFQGPQNTATGNTRTVKLGMPVQQQKAKALLEKAKQTQIKQTPQPKATPTVAGVKRKSTGGDEPSTKIVKTSVSASVAPDGESIRVVQASEEPMDEESRRMRTLLEEQQRKRELIQKRKELARQRQAAAKRKELEARLREQGKTIEDILGGSEEERKVEKEQDSAPVRQISGSVAARLGPPPTQQPVRGPPPQQQAPHVGPAPRMRLPGPQGPPAQRPQLFQEVPPQFQNIQPRGPTSGNQIPGQPRMAGPQIVRMRAPPPAVNLQLRGPPPTADVRMSALPPSGDPRLRGPPQMGGPRMRGPAPTNDPRFQGLPANIHIRGPPPSPDARFRAPPPSSDPRPRGPPPNTDPNFRAPPPRLQGTLPQANVRPPPSPGQPVRYAGPPPGSQLVRTQPPQSISHPQHFAPQYPSSAAATPPSPHHYAPPSQPQPVPYTPPATQYQPQTTIYQPPSYPTPQHQQYQQLQQPPTSHPPTVSQHYAQPATPPYQKPPAPQYHTPPTTQYQSPATAQYSPTSQYPVPATSHYQIPPTHYQSPSASEYQSSPVPSYQSPTAAQHPSTPQSYGSVTEHQYQQHDYSHYSEPQPIQTITHQTATPSPIQDQRTVQHQPPIGQRIQTIGQRVQPVTGTQMRSIIHNVVSPRPSQATPGTTVRQVQSRTPNMMAADGQVHVLDGPQKILIQNVPPVATKETLIKICRHFGQVLGVTLMREQNKAVVQFQKGEQAAKCVAKCDQKCLHKTRLTVKLLPS